MANELLSSFKAASRAYSHIVYNQSTQQFERAGKRHAMATFFGSAEAKAKNNLTLEKIKEALAAEVADEARFNGLGRSVEGLFSNVDGDKRIKSATVKSIIREFRHEAKAASGQLRGLTNLIAAAALDLNPALSARAMDMHITGIEEALKSYKGGRMILEMAMVPLLKHELSGKTIEEALNSLRDYDCKKQLIKNIGVSFINFLIAVNNAGGSYKNDLIAILNMGKEKDLVRFDAIIGCELSRIVNGWADNNSYNFSLPKALGELRKCLEGLSAAQRALMELDAIPLQPESYDLALDFCGWNEEIRSECLDLLSRQPVENRMPLLSAMKVFGGSRDVFLLQKLVGVQDKINVLHGFGSLTPENIYSAIEGDSAPIPECVVDAGTSVGAEETMSNYFAAKAATEMEAAIEDKGKDWSFEKRILVQSKGLKLMRTQGISANEAMERIEANPVA